MAVNIAQIPIVRSDVHDWLVGYAGPIAPDAAMETFLHGKVDELSLPDEYIYTPGADDPANVIHIVDYLLKDIASYA